MSGAGARAATFFGYWAGELPAVTALHFRSFVHHHPGARYELWLDDDHASRIEAPALRWIEAHPAIRVRTFSLDALIERHVSGRPVSHYERWRTLRRIARGFCGGFRGGLLRATRRRDFAPSRSGPGPRHSSLLFDGFSRDRVYRSHLARCLIALEHYPGPCLYSDLDVCFLTDLRHHCEGAGWAYRRPRHAYAHSALLYLPDGGWSEALVRAGRVREDFHPGALLTDDACRELGLRIHPARLFEPLADTTSLLYGDPQLFFGARDNPDLDLLVLTNERHLAIHWHDNWNMQPAPSSLYARLLEACKERDA